MNVQNVCNDRKRKGRKEQKSQDPHPPPKEKVIKQTFRWTQIRWVLLVSHYSAIGSTIACDAPYSAVGFRGKFFQRCPPPRPVFGLRLAIFKTRSEGVAAIVCDWKSKFLDRYRPEGIFRIFFGLILDPPPVHMLLQRKKGKFICTGHFFPHGMAFLEKRGGLVPVYVFIFPAAMPQKKTVQKGSCGEVKVARLQSEVRTKDLF